MTINRLNQVWLSDIIYIRIRTALVYLAAILDTFSRKVIGYAVSTLIRINIYSIPRHSFNSLTACADAASWLATSSHRI